MSSISVAMPQKGKINTLTQPLQYTEIAIGDDYSVKTVTNPASVQQNHIWAVYVFSLLYIEMDHSSKGLTVSASLN